MIQYADCKIRVAHQRVAALERAMIELGRTIRALPETHPASQEAQCDLRRLGIERDAAVLDLEELVLLDELPADEMHQA